MTPSTVCILRLGRSKSKDQSREYRSWPNSVGPPTLKLVGEANGAVATRGLRAADV